MREAAYFDAVASRRLVRPSVRAICLAGGNVLAQRPADSPGSPFAFIGGEYEAGDTMEGRLRLEFEEETTAKLVSARYLFVVENAFRWKGRLVHLLEHYMEVELDRREIESREPHLTQHWLPLARLAEFDLRPFVVRDALIDGRWREVRHLKVPVATAQ
jgi:ADP-ribose pyrophosphatase YjhB (NUDIX family)